MSSEWIYGVEMNEFNGLVVVGNGTAAIAPFGLSIH